MSESDKHDDAELNYKRWRDAVATADKLKADIAEASRIAPDIIGAAYEMIGLKAQLSEARRELEAAKAGPYCHDTWHTYIPPNCRNCAKPICPNAEGFMREFARAERAESKRDALKKALRELYAIVKGECPSLLDEDSELDMRATSDARTTWGPNDE